MATIAYCPHSPLLSSALSAVAVAVALALHRFNSCPSDNNVCDGVMLHCDGNSRPFTTVPDYLPFIFLTIAGAFVC